MGDQSHSKNANNKMPLVGRVASRLLPTGGVASSLLPPVYQYPPKVMIIIPPLGKFSGVNNDSKLDEQFQGWIGQFQLVASVHNWDKRAKLVNLSTRLSGQAFAFYRSCSTQQRADYDALVGEMKKHFTPVRLQAVQSSLFHDQRQGINESVDMYAQKLRTLFFPCISSSSAGSTGNRTNGLFDVS